jgi:hypothetical protein
VLNVVELKEPSYTGAYLYYELVKVTDFYDITKAIFTITHDNTTPNDLMLKELESIVETQ